MSMQCANANDLTSTPVNGVEIGIPQVLQLWVQWLRGEPTGTLQATLWFFWTTRARILLLGTKLSVGLTTLCIISCLVACARNEVDNVWNALRFVGGMYSGTWAQWLFSQRRKQILEQLDQLNYLTLDFQSLSNLNNVTVICRGRGNLRLRPKTIGISASESVPAASWHRKLFTMSRAYAAAASIFVLVPPLFGGLIIPMWPFPIGIFWWIALVFQAYAAWCCCAAVFALSPLIYFTTDTFSMLFHALVQQMRNSTDHVQFKAAVHLHQRVCQSAHAMENIYSKYIGQFLLGLLVLPLLGIRDLTAGRVDPIMIMTLPMIIFVFIPFCWVGEALKDASQNVGMVAYDSLWFERSTDERKLRLFAALRASRPSTLSVYGIGPLHLPACYSALKAWFSYLQLCLNLGS